MKWMMAWLVIFGWATVNGQELGRIDFANSGHPRAQADFQRGMAALYSFWYEEARAAFREARKQDPDFAMAYWGEAMSYHQSLWGRQNLEQARSVMTALGPTPEARLAKAPTAREQGFIAALEVLFGSPGSGTGSGDQSAADHTTAAKKQRDRAYSEHMQRLHRKFPEDVDVAAFYALSILGSIDLGKDVRGAVRAAAVLEPFFAQHPSHPGVLHYLIHAYDDAIHAPLGLRAARLYAKAAPASAHALHMPSHIFVQLGMWSQVEASNIDASTAGMANKEPRQYDHAITWLMYSFLQQGKFARAREMLDTYWEQSENFSSFRERIVATSAARYLVETQAWGHAESLAEHLDRASDDTRVIFARGLAAAFSNNISLAEEHHKALEAAASAQREERPRRADQTQVQAKMIEGVLLWQQHQWPKAEEVLQQAVDLDEAFGLPIGPPSIIKPPHELYGELLLLNDRAERARDMFAASLDRTPNRPWSLYGLAVAAFRMNDMVLAQDAWQRLQAVWGATRPPVYETLRRLMETTPTHRNLTNHPANDRMPVWSPDGKQIAFVSDREGQRQLYLMDPDGRNVRRLETGPGQSQGPAFSPDSRYLLFHNDRDGQDDIYRLDLTTDAVQRLTDHPAADRDARYAPNGEWIAFTSERDGNMELYLMAPDGGRLKRLTNHPQRDVWASWEPDSRHLIFFSRRDTQGTADELYRLSLNGGEPQRLTEYPAHDFCPAVSPDGRHVVFSGKRTGGRSELYVMDLSDRSLKRLTFDGNGDSTAAWSPDGHHLVWSTYNPEHGAYDVVTRPFLQQED